jgi:hypothetical protein
MLLSILLWVLRPLSPSLCLVSLLGCGFVIEAASLWYMFEALACPCAPRLSGLASVASGLVLVASDASDGLGGAGGK